MCIDTGAHSYKKRVERASFSQIQQTYIESLCPALWMLWSECIHPNSCIRNSIPSAAVLRHWATGEVFRSPLPLSKSAVGMMSPSSAFLPYEDTVLAPFSLFLPCEDIIKRFSNRCQILYLGFLTLQNLTGKSSGFFTNYLISSIIVARCRR